jgi:hypothetical protein
MIDRAAARIIAAEHIEEGKLRLCGGLDGKLVPDFTPVIVDAWTLEREFGWVFFWDSEEHQRTGDFRSALAGNAPPIVDRHDGSIHVTGTAHPVEFYIEEYLRRRRGE